MVNEHVIINLVSLDKILTLGNFNPNFETWKNIMFFGN